MEEEAQQAAEAAQAAVQTVYAEPSVGKKIVDAIASYGMNIVAAVLILVIGI